MDLVVDSTHRQDPLFGEARTKLCELTPERRVEVVRRLLEIYRPLLADLDQFTTLGALTKKRVGAWDYGGLMLEEKSPCMILFEFDCLQSGSLVIHDETYPATEEGKMLFLTPTARFLVFSWRHSNRILQGIPYQVVQDKESERTRLTSPTAAELGALLTGSRIRRIAEVLSALTHRRAVEFQTKATALTLMEERADEFMAGIP